MLTNRYETRCGREERMCDDFWRDCTATIQLVHKGVDESNKNAYRVEFVDGHSYLRAVATCNERRKSRRWGAGKNVRHSLPRHNRREKCAQHRTAAPWRTPSRFDEEKFVVYGGVVSFWNSTARQSTLLM